MTIKEATQQMLREIESKKTQEALRERKRTYDKQIAKLLGITPASYSRLRTGVTQPKITTWYKIIKLHEEVVGPNLTIIILNKINYD